MHNLFKEKTYLYLSDWPLPKSIGSQSFNTHKIINKQTNKLGNRAFLIALLCEQFEQFVVMHIVKRIDIHSQRIRHTFHVQTERFEQI